MMRRPELIESDLGSITISYSVESRLSPRVTPSVGRQEGVDFNVLETANHFARLLSYRTFGVRPPLFLGADFLGNVISHQARVLIASGSPIVAASLEAYYTNLSKEIDGF